MGTYLEVFVGGLLVLSMHSGWLALCEGSDKGEDTKGNQNTEGSVASDSESLSWWCLSSGAVCTESNVVCYTQNVSQKALPTCATHCWGCLTDA